jgi:hypothetical protein
MNIGTAIISAAVILGLAQFIIDAAFGDHYQIVAASGDHPVVFRLDKSSGELGVCYVRDANRLGCGPASRAGQE